MAALKDLAPGAPPLWSMIAAFAAFLALFAAFLIAGVARRTLKQKREADNISEWWKRSQWAMEATTLEEAAVLNFGKRMLKLLVESDMAGDEDKLVLDAIREEFEFRRSPTASSN